VPTAGFRHVDENLPMDAAAERDARPQEAVCISTVVTSQSFGIAWFL
jgi:hypothetical protein